MSEGNFSNLGNTIDKFKGMSPEDVKRELSKTNLPFAALMMQLKGDFNFSTLVRNANAFGAEEVFYHGPKKKWDKRGAVGTYHYTKVNYLKTFEEIEALREHYPHFIAMDILPGVSTSMFEYDFKPGTLLFFGEEGSGLTDEFLSMCDAILHIPQRGSVRSVNVGTASGIAMSHVARMLS